MNPIKIVLQAVDEVTPIVQSMTRGALISLGRTIDNISTQIGDTGKRFRDWMPKSAREGLIRVGQVIDDIAANVNGVGKRFRDWKPPKEVNQGILGLAQGLGMGYSQAEKMSKQLKGLDTDKAIAASKRLQELQGAGLSTAQRFGVLQKEMGLTRNQFERLEQSTQRMGGGMGKLGGILATIGQSFLGLQQIAMIVMNKLSQAWGMFIGQNEQLNQQILSASANLAATSVVVRAGIEIEDPTEAIKALEGPLKRALDGIAKDSLDLVGVTSSQLTDVFNILISQSAKLAGQSKEFADPIQAASKLTIDFSAAFGTMGMPLQFARQEIVSILAGTIDVNSQLAKSLGISNEMVNKWKAQGTLVDELRKRLEPAVKGNALAAKSIGGITSNIQELLEITTRAAGKPLFGFAVESLDKFYQFLKSNEATIQAIFQQIANAIKTIGLEFVEAGEQFQEHFGEDLGTIFIASIDAIVQALTAIATGIAIAIKALVAFDQKIPIVSKTLERLAGLINRVAEGYRRINMLVRVGSGQWDASANAVEVYQNQLNLLGDQAIRILQETEPRIRELQDKQAKGIALSEAEQKELAALQGRREESAKLLRSLKTDIEGANVVGEEHQGVLQGMSGEIDRLTGAMGSVEVQARGIASVGTIFEDLARKAGDARKAVQNQGEGDQAAFENAAKNLTSLTQQRLDLGAISLEQAKEDYRLILQNTSLSADARLAAEKGYTSAVAQGVQKRLEMGQLSVEQARAELEAIATNADLGKTARADAEKQLTGIVMGEIQKRLEMGQLNIEQARTELEAIASNTDLSAATRREAEQRLTSVISGETQKRLELSKITLDQARAELEAIATNTERGASARMEAEKQLTSIVSGEIQKRLDMGQMSTQEAIAQLQAITTNTELSDEARFRAEKEITGIVSGEVQQRLELGQMSTQEAIAQLETIVASTKLSADTRYQIEQQLTQLIQQEAGLRQAAINASIAETEAAVRQGQMDELSGAQEVTRLKKEQLDLQIQDTQAAIAREKAAGRSDTARYRELVLQARELQASRAQIEIDGEIQVQSVRMGLLERQQQEALDLVRLAETERLASIQQLINEGTLSEGQAQQQRLQLTRERIESEIAAEEEKLETLRSLPPLSDPEAEAQRQARIRQQTQATAQMRLQLLDNERQQQQALLTLVQERIDRELRVAQNASQEQVLGLERQIRLSETYSQTLNRQNELLQARRGLAQTLISAAEAEIGILQATAKSDKERRQLTELSAAIKLEAIREQNQLELENLRIQRLQNEAALERERIQNRIAQIQAQAEAANIEAQIAKAQADPRTRPEEMRALQLQLQAQQQRQEGLASEAQLLERNAAIQRELLNIQEQSTMRQGRTSERQAELEYAQSIGNRRRRDRALREVRGEALDALGISGRGLGGSDAILQTADRLVPEVDRSINPLGPTPVLAGQQAQLQGVLATAEDGTQKIVTAIDQLRQEGQRGPVTIQSTIQNTFTGADVQNGNMQRQIEQQMIDSQYRIFQDLERRQAA